MVFLELWWHRSHCHKYMKGLEGGKKDLRRKKNALGRKEGLNKSFARPLLIAWLSELK